MFERLFSNLFKADLVVPKSQPQREAVIDTLVFAMTADGEISQEEREELDHAFEELAWADADTRTPFVRDSITRASQAKQSPEHARAYIHDIGQRLETAPLRERAYELASRIVCADHEVDQAERGLMSMFIREFQISEERALEISATVHEDFDMI